MQSFPSQNEIVDSIFDGIETAKKNFSYWTTDELYLSDAPSNFLSIHVAQSIAKLTNPPEIFMDATIADILACSLSSQTPIVEFMKKNQISQNTIDITLDKRFEHQNDDDSISKVIINLKNGVRNAKDEYRKNIETLCKIISTKEQQESTLEYAVFAFYLDISNKARIKADKRIEEIIGSFDTIVASYKNLKSHFKGGDIIKIENIGEWCVGCYIIEPK